MHYSLFVSLIFFCHASGNTIHRRVVRQSDFNFCQTPGNTTGLCVPVNDCPFMHELLKTVLTPEMITFLRQSSCGKIGERKVCCDENTLNVPNESPSTSTDTPNVRRPVPETSPDDDEIDPPARRDYSACGRSNRKSVKIVGGQNATLGDWPWIVALGYRSGNDRTKLWRCGGSLISDRWVITAGHCVEGIGSLKLTTARMGELHLDENVDDGASPVDIEIQQVVRHPQLTLGPLQNDIALLRLSRPITFTENIRPICIPSNDMYKGDDFYANKSPYIAGWGHTQYKGSGSKMLREAQIDIDDRDYCAQKYKSVSRNMVDIRSLCASRPKVDACQGDSGGPLILTIGPAFYLAGIVSFGAECALPGYPGVYTKVAYFSDWIRTVTGIRM